MQDPSAVFPSLLQPPASARSSIHPACADSNKEAWQGTHLSLLLAFLVFSRSAFLVLRLEAGYDVCMSERILQILDLGLRDYDDVWALQRELHAKIAGEPGCTEHLILVEHPPVITLGRRADKANVLYSEDELAKRGVQLRHVDRGGDVTYHGPGQLVAYPIVRLAGKRRDVHRYFRTLEQIVIDLLAEYAIDGRTHEGLTGVWVGEDKICAMGVAIRRWTTYHGIALNVSTDLDHFRLITPCGIADKGVTSMEALLGRAVPLAEAGAEFVQHFAEAFDFTEVRS